MTRSVPKGSPAATASPGSPPPAAPALPSRRLGSRLAQDALVVALAVAASWFVFDVATWAYGEAPLAMARVLWQGTWGTAYGVGQVLFKATPLLVTGVAVEVGLRAGLFNIGAEGQLAVASLAVGALASHLSRVPAALALPSVLVVALAAGGAWAAVPAFLRVRFGAHEVVTTIMMNRIADALVAWLLAAGLALPGSMRTADAAPGARLGRLDLLFPALHGSAASLAVFVALGVTFSAVFAFARTRLGREIVLVGLGPRACIAEHIPVGRRMAQALVASGAIAGLASAGTVLGYKGYFEMGLGAGAGFGGLAVALLGRSRPVGMVLAALFFGTLAQGGLAINAHVPRELMDVLSGVVIVAVALTDVWTRAAFASPAEAGVA